jgi:hypothetical protein
MWPQLRAVPLAAAAFTLCYPIPASSGVWGWRAAVNDLKTRVFSA